MLGKDKTLAFSITVNIDAKKKKAFEENIPCKIYLYMNQQV